MLHVSIRRNLIISLLLLATTPVNAQDKALSAKLADMASREFQERNTLHQALTHINQAIKLDQKSGNNYFIRAEIYTRMEEDEMALKDINRAVELAPTQAYFYECKANILLTFKKNKEALEAANMAIR
jgi:regulator of sirC expression with transglutaminase-like and TPR domain